ncbi:hypothetical protein HNP73_001157 [Amaricoccus macauensis]|uniref:Uncharacterized protein n=1 Tax=Amaricoccus macauensis TaxID=57001 RepID=A0A840SMZ3_9RHOB|nr:hypothetical protein [Amaricoccus macauensis]MBB5221236.1 hypothetical protein [Amaricoccus macauensis]
MQVAAQQPDQPVAQVAAVEQRQEDEDEDDTGRGNRGERRHDPLGRRLEGRGGFRDDFDLRGGRPLIAAHRLLDLVLHRGHRLPRTVEHPGPGHALPEVGDLGADRALVGRDLGTERAHLRADDEPEHQHEGHDDDEHRNDREDARQAAPRKPGDERAEGEADEKRNRQRDQDVLADVEAEQDERTDRQPRRKPHDVGLLPRVLRVVHVVPPLPAPLASRAAVATSTGD